MLPSMPKGETVGNVVIDGKGERAETQQRQWRQQEECQNVTVTKARRRIVIGR